MEYEKADKTEVLHVRKKVETEYCTIKNFKEFVDKTKHDMV